jgi:hypothetical protein
MKYKSILEWGVFASIVVLLIVSVQFDLIDSSLLKGQFIRGGESEVTQVDSYGYGYDYNGNWIHVNSGNLEEFDLEFPFNQLIVLDGTLPRDVEFPDDDSSVKWEVATDNPSVVSLADTLFPSFQAQVEGYYVFFLDLLRGGAYMRVAEYTVLIRNPLSVASDLDSDNDYDFDDLLMLLQNWNDYSNAREMFAYILSQYEEE